MSAGKRAGDGARDVRRQHQECWNAVGRTWDGDVEVVRRGCRKCWESLSMKSGVG